MKKLLFILTLSLQTIFVFAAGKSENLAMAHYEKSKMYRQPGTATEVLLSLTSTDKIVVVRKYNAHWTIVTINGQVGYMLTAELSFVKPQNASVIAKK